jgi:hypothetical protein
MFLRGYLSKELEHCQFEGIPLTAGPEGEARGARRPLQVAHECEEKLEIRDRRRIPEGLLLDQESSLYP